MARDQLDWSKLLRKLPCKDRCWGEITFARSASPLLLLSAEVRLDNVVDVVVDGVVLDLEELEELVFGGGLVFSDAMMYGVWTSLRIAINLWRLFLMITCLSRGVYARL